MRNPVKTIRDKFATRSFEKRYARTAKLVAPYIADGTERPSEVNRLNQAFQNPAMPETIDFKTQFLDDNGDIKASAIIRMPPSSNTLDVIALRLAAEKLKPSVEWTKAKIDGSEFIADKDIIANELMPDKHDILDLAEIFKSITMRIAYDDLLKAAAENNVTKIRLDIPGIEDLPEFDELNTILTKSMASQHHLVFDVEYH